MRSKQHETQMLQGPSERSRCLQFEPALTPAMHAILPDYLSVGRPDGVIDACRVLQFQANLGLEARHGLPHLNARTDSYSTCEQLSHRVQSGSLDSVGLRITSLNYAPRTCSLPDALRLPSSAAAYQPGNAPLDLGIRMHSSGV